ncbi:hypothetical protein ACEWY4_013550 [Coilia grayii]|uniref:SEFIR domain-containing protein n=1 Tax=Coilia grayii TaxID=363190 RepID=A0ABD1JWM4_9TELE
MALGQLFFCCCLLVLLSSTNSLNISNNTSKGLHGCVAEGEGHFMECGDSAVDVVSIEAEVHPCCKRDRGCVACLQVRLMLHVTDEDDEGEDDVEEESSTEDVAVKHPSHVSRSQKSAILKLCYTVTPQLTRCQCVECAVRPKLENTSGPEWLVLERDVTFGDTVHVTAKANHVVKNITKIIPPREPTVCRDLSCLDVEPPKLTTQVDLKKGEVKIRVKEGETHPVDMCLKTKRAQLCKLFNGTIPLHSVTPCLCIQAWWQNKDHRSENCPFSTQNLNADLPKGLPEENALAKVSASLELGRIHRGLPVLRYNVSVPCQGKLEVRLCHMAAAGICQDVTDGTGQDSYQEGHEAWMMSNDGSWVISGAFVNIASHLPPCIKLNVMEKDFGPWCAAYTSRWHWSIPIFAVMLLLSLIALGLYLKRTTLEKCFQKWQRRSLLQGGRGHVLLLHPPCDDPSLSELVCLLGSALKSLGFSVSLDLWCHTELGAVGPVPWLHSQMELLRSRGGRAVLVLSHAALERAGEWSGLSQGGPRGGGGFEGEEQGGGPGPHCPSSLPPTEVFSVALSCLLEDHQRGFAQRRFSMVQFDSHSPFTPAGVKPTLPLLFRGLSLYRLPTESQAFLNAVMAEQQDGVLERSWRWQSRWLSRELKRRLQNTDNLTGERLSRVLEDSGETVPLQP